jgi:5'-3' exonuclease
MKKNKDVLSLLDGIKQDKISLSLHRNSKILIVDGINTFIRSFSAINHFNLNGHHVGGLTGFLKSIGYAIRNISPTRVIIVFDGEGGSTNKRYLYPEYKTNRDNKNKIINWKSFQSKDEEKEAQKNEVERLVDYLECLPVSMIAIDKLEADDIIGYIAKKTYSDYDDSEVCIMSSDGDFLQLVNDRIFVYSPTKKKYYYTNDIIKEFGSHPSNFLLYKVLVGDISDNVTGVNGIGKKNVLKLFPQLSSESKLSLQDIYQISESSKKGALYERVLLTKNQIEIFYNIMNLSNPNLSEDDIMEIDEMLQKKIDPLRKSDFLRLYYYDRMNNSIPGVEIWLNIFSVLNAFVK